MNFKQVEVFVAIVESGNFSRGAEVVKISQSTASQHIAALEESCGVKLLDRLGRTVLPTEAGKVLLQNGRAILSTIRKTEQELRQFIHGEEAELKIGCSSIPCAYIFPNIINLIYERHPNLKMNIMQGDSQEALEMLRKEEVEVAIVGSIADDDTFSFQPLVKDSIRLVVGRTHAWAGRKNITLDELLKEPLVVREEGSGTAKSTLEALKAVGVQPEQLNVRVRIGSNEAVIQAAVLGVGVAFASELSIKREVDSGDLYPVDLEGISIKRDFFIASRRGREMSPSASAFISAALTYYHLQNCAPLIRAHKSEGRRYK